MTPPPDPPGTSSFPGSPAPLAGSTLAHPGLPEPAAEPVAIPGYEILGELGRGGMGVVYKARQLSLNRTVALKMVLGTDQSDPKGLARFLAEAEVVAAVRHPNVVQVYEYGQHAGRPFFAMEYLDGGSLAGLLGSSGRLPPRDAALLVEQIARGVQAAHDLGIVHRDIKPANILLAGVEGRKVESRKVDDGAGSAPDLTTLRLSGVTTPKVTDFGIAKRSSQADLTRTGAVMGTPNYMSPEQAAGKAKFVGPAADIYALGVVLYECLTGTVPFEAEDTVRLLLKVAEDEPPPVHDRAPDVPRDLEAVCQKCLRKEPHARYASAGELADDLRRFLDGQPVAARSTGLVGRVVGALNRSLKDHEFAAYASAMFWFAAVMLGADLIVTLAVFGTISPWAILPAQWGRIVGFLAVLGWYRKWRLVPETGTERQLWAIVGGYLVTCVLAAVCLRVAFVGFGPGQDIYLYPSIAMLTALMFFSLGAVLWGWCYAFGAAFAAAGFLMAADLRLAPLIFGTTWALVLALIGLRLRRLARGR